MMQSELLNELAAALANAQGKIRAAAKDTENPFFKSKYADLSSVWEACRAELSDEGLAIVQLPGESDHGPVLRTTLLHKSGQWIASEVPLMVGEKSTMQTLGSAITYARRYGLAAMVGVVADEDDDGNAASKELAPARQSRKPPTADPQATIGEHPTVSTKRSLYAALQRIGAIKAGMPDEEKREVARKYCSRALEKDVTSVAEMSPMDLTTAASWIGALTGPINTN